jgi:hypothetical protein
MEENSEKPAPTTILETVVALAITFCFVIPFLFYYTRHELCHIAPSHRSCLPDPGFGGSDIYSVFFSGIGLLLGIILLLKAKPWHNR